MKFYTLFAAICIAAASSTMVQAKETTPYSTWSINNTKGEDYSDPDGNFFTHAIPADFPTRTHQGSTPRFNVAVNGHYVALYSDRDYWGGVVSFGMFEFEDGKEVEIEISSRERINTFELLPKSLAEFTEEPELTDSHSSVRFKIKKADQKFSFIINGDYKGSVLHLFANSVDKDDPKIEVPEGKSYVWDRQKKTYYFKKGYVNLEEVFGNSTFSTSGRNIYIPAGSVVDGQLSVNSNCKIHGRGMLMNITQNMLLSLNWGNTSTVEGITIYGHGRSQAWTCGIDNFSNATISNVNVIATNYASVDGFDLNYATDCTFDNCFIRTADDCIAIKALNTTTRQGPTKNLTFTRMQLWNDCNNAFGMGAETNATIYENIKLLDSEILFSYDDPTHHEELDERSTMNICCLQGTYFKNILFENIYVDNCQRLIGLGFKDNFWFNSIKGDQSTEGGISGVTFRNITCPNLQDSSIANEIHLYGWKQDGTPDKWVEDITFDNVVIEGKLLADESDSHIVKNEMVRDLKFLNSGVDEHIADDAQFSVHQSGNILLIESSSDSAQWALYSLSGQLISSGNGKEISVDGLQPSLYLVRVVTSGNQFASFKVFVK